MTAPTVLAPTLKALDRVLREQRRRGSAAWFEGRKAALQCGGPGMVQRQKKIDQPAFLRVMATAGLKPGEMCGCREHGCETCLADGSALNACRCGGANCRRCTPTVAAWLAAGQDGDGGEAGPPDWGEVVPIAMATPMTDIHSHNFRAKGVGRMCISGMRDSGVVGAADGFILDDLVEHASIEYPGFFEPFVRGFEQEGAGLGDATAPAYVKSKLAAGFSGVGE